MDIYKLLATTLLLYFSVLESRPALILVDEDDIRGNSGRCPWIRNTLKNGKVKIRSRGRVARFSCNSGYELIGKRFATCVRGEWNSATPVCVANGCDRMKVPSNAKVKQVYSNAVLLYDCLPGYILRGPSTLTCDGANWSSEAPECEVPTDQPETSCDFEDPSICGWAHDPTHEFDWKRNKHATPSGYIGTGPYYDHTYGSGKLGFYMYLEASAPQQLNDKCRLYSPVYPQSYSPGCFIFWYHMYGYSTGSLMVYIKPESSVFDEVHPVWQKNGDQGNLWLRGNISIPAYTQSFQIIIEGVVGDGYLGDIAIDDVDLLQSDCNGIEGTDNSSVSTLKDSCRGRCGESVESDTCGCTSACVIETSCCSDYETLCSSDAEDGNTTDYWNEGIRENSTASSTPFLGTVSHTVPITEIQISSAATLVTGQALSTSASKETAVPGITTTSLVSTEQTTQQTASRTTLSSFVTPLITLSSTAMDITTSVPPTLAEQTSSSKATFESTTPSIPSSRPITQITNAVSPIDTTEVITIRTISEKPMSTTSKTGKSTLLPAAIPSTMAPPITTVTSLTSVERATTESQAKAYTSATTKKRTVPFSTRTLYFTTVPSTTSSFEYSTTKLYSTSSGTGIKTSPSIRPWVVPTSTRRIIPWNVNTTTPAIVPWVTTITTRKIIPWSFVPETTSTTRKVIPWSFVTKSSSTTRKIIPWSFVTKSSSTTEKATLPTTATPTTHGIIRTFRPHFDPKSDWVTLKPRIVTVSPKTTITSMSSTKQQTTHRHEHKDVWSFTDMMTTSINLQSSVMTSRMRSESSTSVPGRETKTIDATDVTLDLLVGHNSLDEKDSVPSPSARTHEDDEISSGSVAGPIVGITIAVIGVGGLVIYYFLQKRRKRARYDNELAFLSRSEDLEL